MAPLLKTVSAATVAVAVAASLLTSSHKLTAPTSLAAPPIVGDVAYITFAAGSDFQLELASWSLARNTSTQLQLFPPDEYESGYVAGTTLLSDNQTWIISLQYDANPDQGVLVQYDLVSGVLSKVYNDSFCFGVWENAADKSGDTLLCLSLVACADKTKCSQETQLHIIDRTTGKDRTIAPGIAQDMAPYTVETYDPHAGIVYSCFANLDAATAGLRGKDGLVTATPGFRTSASAPARPAQAGKLLNRRADPYAALPLVSEVAALGREGKQTSSSEGGLRSFNFGNVLVALNASTGEQLWSVKFEDQVAYLQLEYDAGTRSILSVVQTVFPSNGTSVSYLSTVDGKTGAFQPLPSSPDFAPFYGQLNTISTVAPEQNAFFFTAFHYVGQEEGQEGSKSSATAALRGTSTGNSPLSTPTPYLYLIGLDTRTGEQRYAYNVLNPFCDIEWTRTARAE